MTRKTNFIPLFLGAISWFEHMFMQIGQAAEGSSVDLSFKFFVTCLCDPEAVPPIPNSAVAVSKPTIGQMLEPLLAHATEAGGAGGGVGIAASGPESLTRAAQNVVASIGPKTAAAAGGIELHTELFAL